MAFFIDRTGATIDVPADKLGADLYKRAFDANMAVPAYVNSQFPEANTDVGTAFQQLCASEGLSLPEGKNPFGLRPATVGEILDGKAGFQAAGNVKDSGSPFGIASRTLFPAALVEMIEDKLAKDYTTDSVVFSEMVAMEQSLASENFEQPVISYGTPNGPEQARSQRIAQFAEPSKMMRFATADRFKKLPTYSIGLEFSQQALRATSLDLVAMMVTRQLEVERDARVYGYINDVFLGDADLNIGAVGSATSTSFDSLATGGVLTHRAWVKFLAANRKFRKVTHVMGDIDTYLKVEGRTGRPGSNSYDPTLTRIDPQANPVNVGFGNDVRWFITDTVAEGGPVPAGEVWAIDASKAIVRVTNTAANYTASESFALRKSEAMRMDHSEACYRMFGDTELRPFARLVIA